MGWRRASLAIQAATIWLAGCGGELAPAQLPAQSRPPTGTVRHLIGEELHASQAAAAVIDAACAGQTYVPSPDAALIPVKMSVSVRLSAFFVGPVEFCMLVDGARALTNDGAREAARRLAGGEQLTVTPTVSSSARHDVVIVVHFDGAGPARGYHFRVATRHLFMTEGPGALEAVVHELPGSDRPIEQRPTITWHESGGIIPGPQTP